MEILVSLLTAGGEFSPKPCISYLLATNASTFRDAYLFFIDLSPAESDSTCVTKAE